MFIPTPSLLPLRPRQKPRGVPRVAACATNPSARDDDLIDDTSAPSYLQQFLDKVGPPSSASTTAANDVAAAAQSSATPTGPRPARSRSTAPQPKPKPKQKQKQTQKASRPRGRPKGSSSQRKIQIPLPFPSSSSSSSSPPVSPFDFRQSMPPNPFPLPKPSSLTDSDGTFRLRAPSGHKDGPRDFLPELLPLLAADEIEADREPTEHELHVRRLLHQCSGIIASGHRFSGRLQNLRPFATRIDPRICDACDGKGMVTCSYCHGEGFVDFGEGAKKFYEDFNPDEMLLPKNVTGNIYHCPMCGGLKQERCVKCLGSGTLPPDGEDDDDNDDDDEDDDDENDRTTRQPKGAAANPFQHAFSDFDFEAFKEENKDHIETGLDGTVILRHYERRGRTKNKRKKKVDIEDADETTEQLSDVEDVKPDQLSSESFEKNLHPKMQQLEQILAQLVERDEAAASGKKRRGRQPKNKKNISVPTEVGSSLEQPKPVSATAAEKAQGPAPVKRKRGRPRKAVPVTEPSIIQQIELASENAQQKTEKQAPTAVKRKRGRPRKANAPDPMEIDTDTDTDIDIDTAQSSSPASDSVRLSDFIQGKKVPKNSTDFVNTTDYQVGRRLRKQKSIEELNDSISSECVDL